MIGPTSDRISAMNPGIRIGLTLLALGGAMMCLYLGMDDADQIVQKIAVGLAGLGFVMVAIGLLAGFDDDVSRADILKELKRAQR